MKLLELKASRYRSIKSATVAFGDLNVFIGANASGKSTVLDALRFFHLGLRERDFRETVEARGGFSNLAWNGEDTKSVTMSLRFQRDGDKDKYEWSIILIGTENEFSVREEMFLLTPEGQRVQLLSSDQGVGWWRSGEEQEVQLQQAPTACALASASADANFPGRSIANFVTQWGFFDPSPFFLRQERAGTASNRLDALGRNLAERLFRLRESSPETFKRIVAGVGSFLGIPMTLDPRESEGSYFFTQMEHGLTNPVHQMVTSAGTVRMLALITALFEDSQRGLVAIEEPENNIHPTALREFTDLLTELSSSVQILITTHSPFLLDFLQDPSVIYVVKRDGIEGTEGTQVFRESNADGVRKALEESGFSLGEYHQTRGFGH